MRDYAYYFIDRKAPEKKGVSIKRDIDWWMGYFAGRMGKMLFVVLLAVLFLVLQFFWVLGKSQARFPIENVQLHGNVVLTRSDDIQAVLPNVKQQSFFDVDLADVSQKIQSLPWIESASVERVWPNTLNVTLTERQVAYRWGEKELVDIYGNRFLNTAPELFAKLPKIDGVEGHESEVIYAYQQLRQALGHRVESLDINYFTLNKYLSWELHLNSGLVVKFGRDNYQKRLERFSDAYLLGQIPDLGRLKSLDFRYNKGFSVKWKTEFFPSDAKLANNSVGRI